MIASFGHEREEGRGKGRRQIHQVSESSFVHLGPGRGICPLQVGGCCVDPSTPLHPPHPHLPCRPQNPRRQTQGKGAGPGGRILRALRDPSPDAASERSGARAVGSRGHLKRRRFRTKGVKKKGNNQRSRPPSLTPSLSRSDLEGVLRLVKQNRKQRKVSGSDPTPLPPVRRPITRRKQKGGVWT